ncbi:hypothetical protein EDC04DRAFT_2890056 [Pisolithus marmoratus]|nr:hypothetical protein EDC04DRAFT_2890056 [Pisolithus marmoratus]
MHNCLLIVDLLREILLFLDPPSLCSVARTCRVFYEPATEIIWRELKGFPPILRLSPNNPESNEHGEPPHVVTRPLTSTVNLVCQSVRNMHVVIAQKPSSCSITPESLLHLLHALENETLESLFPNLQHLTFNCQNLSSEPISEGRMLDLLRILIRPQLSTLQLRLMGWFWASLNASRILTLCSDACTLHTNTTSPETQEHSRAFVAPTITADICDASWDLLPSLVRSKTLRQLTIVFRRPRHTTLPPTNDAFADLSYLAIHTPSFELALKYYRWASLSGLRGLKITTRDCSRDDYSEDLQELLTLIPSHGRFLETIVVDLGLTVLLQPRHWVLTKSVLAPYCFLRNLKVLSITLATDSYSPQLTDDDITEMAQSWPLLEELHLKTFDDQWSLPTGLSLRGIMALIQHCPDLKGFSLVFNATEIPGTAYHSDRCLIPNTKIETLQVGNSPLSSPEDVAIYLRLLMPELRMVSTCDRMDSTHKERWQEVSKLLM